jgi:hypothetical protein
MASIAEASSLFEIDVELDGLLEEIEGQVESEGQAAEDLVARFQQFCAAHGEKVDRIGRFARMMEAREQYCRSEAARLTDRARAAAGKVERTKNMVLYYLLSRDRQNDCRERPPLGWPQHPIELSRGGPYIYSAAKHRSSGAL